jgi:hypothetical protein
MQTQKKEKCQERWNGFSSLLLGLLVQLGKLDSTAWNENKPLKFMFNVKTKLQERFTSIKLQLQKKRTLQS